MSTIYTSAEQLIGNTPLVELTQIEKELGLKAKLIAKLELFNPAGSVKDRVALAMINDAEKRGVLSKESVIIEPTSGNTGIGLASVAAARGYKLVIVMPDSMSVERRQIMKAYGAQLVLSPGAKGVPGAIELANQLAASTPNSFIAGQFVNPANVMAHYTTTGPEIYSATDGKVDIFVAGVGTGGTITGTGKYLKEQNSKIKVVAVEPATSPVLSKGVKGPHGIQGIGAGFVPDILDTGIYDEIIPVKDEDAFAYGRLMGKKEGVLVGISSGAALAAAVELARREENAGKQIVVLMPDTGDRYLSTKLLPRTRIDMQQSARTYATLKSDMAEFIDLSRIVLYPEVFLSIPMNSANRPACIACGRCLWTYSAAYTAAVRNAKRLPTGCLQSLAT